MVKKSGSKFSKKQLAAFDEVLQSLRNQALKEVQERIADKREQDIYAEGGDAQDIASDETGRELGYLMTGRDRQKIMLIDAAVSRLAAGAYGICEECEEAIGVMRLKAMPFTRYCISCQAEMEEMDKMAQQRELEEEEKQYIEFAMTEGDPIDD